MRINVGDVYKHKHWPMRLEIIPTISIKHEYSVSVTETWNDSRAKLQPIRSYNHGELQTQLEKFWILDTKATLDCINKELDFSEKL